MQIWRYIYYEIFHSYDYLKYVWPKISPAKNMDFLNLFEVLNIILSKKWNMKSIVQTKTGNGPYIPKNQYFHSDWSFMYKQYKYKYPCLERIYSQTVVQPNLAFPHIFLVKLHLTLFQLEGGGQKASWFYWCKNIKQFLN